jgi:acyl carrier protein
MANIEIVYALEKEFNIKILDAEAEETTTINDIFNLVARKIA